eukprot:4374140-Amphidinium_carterae.1
MLHDDTAVQYGDCVRQYVVKCGGAEVMAPVLVIVSHCWWSVRTMDCSAKLVHELIGPMMGGLGCRLDSLRRGASMC